MNEFRKQRYGSSEPENKKSQTTEDYFKMLNQSGGVQTPSQGGGGHHFAPPGSGRGPDLGAYSGMRHFSTSGS